MNDASFLTRCTCGTLVKLFAIDEVYECPICDRALTVKVNHVQSNPALESFRDWAAKR